MPQIIYANVQKKVDGSIKAKIPDFLNKLLQSDETPGLHIEPMKVYQDARARTGRVSLEYRAVLFRLDAEAGTYYVYVGTWHHDEAIERAQSMTLDLDAEAGVPSVDWGAYGKTPTPPPEPKAHGAPQPKEQVSLLASWGLTRDDMTTRLRLSEAFAEAALKCADEDAVIELCSHAPIGWQGDALLELATGTSIDDIRSKLGLDKAIESDDDMTEDERTVRGFDHPAAKQVFTLVGDQRELQAVLASADFAAWRVFLHPEQRRYVEGSWNGPFRLTGGAGTGKTVVLAHRARELARRDPAARIVLTTYTKNLAAMIREQLQLLDPDLPLAANLGDAGVYVANVDALAKPLLDAAGGDISETTLAVIGRATAALRNRPRGSLWPAAIAQAGESLPVHLKAPGFFASEYTAVVLPNRVSSRSEYFQAPRAGRGVALNRAARSHVWSVIDAYRSTAELEALVDWDEYIAVAAAHAERTATTVADHVLVDEGQDLTPQRWQMLRAMVAPGKDDLFIAEDAHQRIYGSKVVLGRYGIKIVGRSRRLTLNYRTTAQNLKWAVGVLEGADYSDADDDAVTTAGYHSARLGPAVSTHACTGPGEQLDAVAERLQAWQTEDPDLDLSTIAILTRDAATRTQVVTGLSERHVTVKPVEGDDAASRHPVAMTMHRAKGCEFSRVVLFDVSEGSVPAALQGEKYSEDAWSDAMLRERSLLYVAATRARDELVVTWNGNASELIAVDDNG